MWDIVLNKQDLNTAIAIKRKLTRFETHLSDLKATGCVRTSLQTTGGRGGSHGSAAELVGEMSDEIAELRHQLEVEQTILRRALEKLELDETEKKLMLLRYVDCMEWKNVAARMAYSIQQIYRIHANIIEKAGIKE